MPTVFVTGATGFIGRALCLRMQREGWRVRGLVRSAKKVNVLPAGVDPVFVDTISAETDWSNGLDGCNAVAHLAARVHVMNDLSADPLREYRAVNTAGTEWLARRAAQTGVRRFLFVSTVKVHGEGAPYPYIESETPAPADPYSLSKWEAEQALRRIEAESELEVVIVRPPLVYGPGVGSNFLRLMKWVETGLPLPLGSIRNRRSMIYLDNLTDAIAACIDSESAAGETFLLGDGQDLSTPDLVRLLARQMGRTPRVIPCRPTLLRALGTLAGKRHAIERLTGSLFVDTGKIRKRLGWTPPVSVEQGLQETVRWYTRC